jgi:branched-subunit amino acid transport protein
VRASFWLLIALVTAGSMALRVAPLVAHGRLATGPVVERLLKRVPAVALSALAVPGALYVKTGVRYDVDPIRIVAALVGLAVALRTKNMLATLAAGMLVLWTLEAIL